MRTTKYAAFIAMAALVLPFAGCGGDDSNKFVIGIKFDQPNMGFKNADGTFSGFDVDMARYIAKGLGHAEGDIEFKEAVSANRETFLSDGTVDMIVGTYSITDERKQKVDFAGPYFVAGQSLLVRADDDSISGPEDLNGKKLCSVTGSTSATKVKETYADQVQLQEFDGYSKCVTALLGGQIDAVTTDNTILAGYAQANPGQLKLVGEPFSEELYGVGLPKGSPDRDKVNDLIEASYDDGTWETAFKDNLGQSGLTMPTPPPVDRY